MRTVASMKRAIDEAWRAVVRVTSSAPRTRDEALALELAAERDHRRFGTRFTHGRSGYRLSAEYCAKLHVLHHAHEYLIGQAHIQESWRAVNSIAPRVIAAYVLGEELAELEGGTDAELAKRVEGIRAALEIVAAIDYAEDIGTWKGGAA